MREFSKVNFVWHNASSLTSLKHYNKLATRMSLLPLNPPPPFLECPGEPRLTFTAWKRQFDNYLLAIGGDKFPDEQKRALLIHCLGAEGQRLYNTLPLEDDEYSGTVSALTNFFQPKVNVIAERYRFRQRAQHVGESTDHYICASLLQLARLVCSKMKCCVINWSRRHPYHELERGYCLNLNWLSRKL